ncbi:hypothetical protein LA303_08630 [Candidatus Sulfidibacterium hydrothermale]|uniref:hypothetical protein n=1 Tax=Candidatus Sulfidibacterium hydrothermale TaxID=2875962 RepID=UPI001F0A30E5|nr:hypothetical protein [Candidatus Sulfidibacterium hydrothermale]UBM61483.1 hypothetical protein LA303_08630 [Candidatus Sulfidibacterium hydrothermale]
MMTLFKKDNFFLGLLWGLLLPVPLYALFWGIYTLLVHFGVWQGLQQPENIYLLSLAGNILLFRFYFVKWNSYKTGKGVLLITIGLVLLFFYLFFKP